MVKINTIRTVNENISDYESKSGHLSFNDSVRRAIEIEEERHLIIASDRMEVFRHILRNTTSEYESWKYTFGAFACILLSILSTCAYTIIPTHNVIEDPRYWYESIIQFCFSYLPVAAGTKLYGFYFYTNIELVKTFRNFAIIWLGLIISSLLTFGAMTGVWVYVFNYVNPVPLSGYMSYLVIEPNLNG